MLDTFGIPRTLRLLSARHETRHSGCGMTVMFVVGPNTDVVCEQSRQECRKLQLVGLDPTTFEL